MVRLTRWLICRLINNKKKKTKISCAPVSKSNSSVNCQIWKAIAPVSWFLLSMFISEGFILWKVDASSQTRRKEKKNVKNGSPPLQRFWPSLTETDGFSFSHLSVCSSRSQPREHLCWNSFDKSHSFHLVPCPQNLKNSLKYWWTLKVEQTVIVNHYHYV